MPCTTILVGKNASYDGSTIMARNEDAFSGSFNEKKLAVVLPEQQPRHYRSVISKVEIDLPDNPMRYSAMPNAVDNEGIWGAAGINEENVAMTATETITSNPRVLGADPMVEGGIGEEDIVTIVLPYIHSARDGVKRLGSLLEQYGTYELNGIGFQDVNELWWFETIGGHHWIAKRVPDDSYVVMPNQQGIDFFDMTDAFGEKQTHMCSADLLEFISENHLDLSMSDEPAAEQTCFDVRAAFGSRDDADHCYNTPRAWFIERYFNPYTYTWVGENADYNPESDDLPWCLVPEKKITLEDMKYVLSGHMQGTDFDPYAKYGDPNRRGKYRGIAVNRNNCMIMTQLRPYRPAPIMAVEWIAFASNVFNAMVPFYPNVSVAPAYYACTTGTPSTESIYWASRIVAVMSDAHYADCTPHFERYQDKVHALGQAMVRKCDQGWKEDSDPQTWLTACNQEMADLVRAETDKLLGKVIFSASDGMKNGYARSDN